VVIYKCKGIVQFYIILLSNFRKTKYNVDRGAFDISSLFTKPSAVSAEKRAKGKNAEVPERTIPESGRKVKSLTTVTLFVCCAIG
jgi:hypothetical protein